MTDIRKITMNNWLPKSVLCLKSYTKRKFVSDLLAGITVGLVALPLAMAFAIASGVPPQTRMHEAEFHEHVGEENICRSVAEALDRSREIGRAAWRERG